MVTNDDVTKSQAKVIHAALFPGLNYLLRRKRKMEKAGFPHDDKLYVTVCETYEASLRLYYAMHRLPCDGMGDPPRPE